MVIRHRRPLALVGAVLLVVLTAACAPAAPMASSSRTPESSTRTPSIVPTSTRPATPTPAITETPTPAVETPTPAAETATHGPVATLVGAGDIGECGTGGPEETARVISAVLAETPDAIVFTAGDDAYSDGSSSDFARCYDPSWGRFRDRTRPAAGNHEWQTVDAAGYRAYFGRRAGTADRTWYAFDAATWRVIVLDSDCSEVGGCGPSSRQGRWLAAELAAHPTACTLAIWHHPRFSDGPHGNQELTAPLFDALYAAGADVVVSGHDHDYERFAPQDPAGRPDPERGIREFVVGTGGAHRYQVLRRSSTSEVADSSSWGVVELTLRPGSYAWRFEPAGDGTFADAGTGTCH